MSENIKHCDNFICAFNYNDDDCNTCRISDSMPMSCLVKSYFDTLCETVDVVSICKPLKFSKVILNDKIQ